MTNAGFSYLVSRLEREGRILVSAFSLDGVRRSLLGSGRSFIEGEDIHSSSGEFIGRYIYNY